MREAFARRRKDGAVGLTAAAYRANLNANLVTASR